MIAVAALVGSGSASWFGFKFRLNGMSEKIDRIDGTVHSPQHGNAALNGRLMVLEDRGERA